MITTRTIKNIKLRDLIEEDDEYRRVNNNPNWKCTYMWWLWLDSQAGCNHGPLLENGDFFYYAPKDERSFNAAQGKPRV
ncbi:hypothetical protein N9X64_00050 [bacterium]|nr:hypothetical protein [bacterium]